MADVEKEIRRAVDTGEVVFGMTQAEKNILKGVGKVIILSNSIGEEEREKIQYLVKQAKMKSINLDKSSVKLGEICGKPFKISAMIVLKEGKSSILTQIK